MNPKLIKRLTIFSYRTVRLQVAMLFVASLLAGGILSAYLGVDSNFDLKNYHIYNAWAVFENRTTLDFFPCGIQSYFQPLLDLPYYLLAVKWFPDNPALVTFLMGLPAGALFFLTFVSVFSVLKTLPGINRLLLYVYTGLLGFFGITAAAVVFQIGSVTNEIQAACFVVGGVAAFIVLRGRLVASAVVAGILLGIAAGLKLTALTYTLPFLLAALVFYTTWRARIRYFVFFSVAWWLAFIVLYGGWGLTLYNLTGNPLFPMFNNVFKSDWIPAVAFTDPWFRPASWKEVLFYPFYWVNTRAVSESFCTELRYMFALSGVGVMAFWWGLRKSYGMLASTKKSSVPAIVSNVFCSRLFQFMFVFIVGSYIFWEKQFSILRYSIPVAVFTGLMVFLCVHYFATQLCSRDKRAKHLFVLSLLGFFTVVSVVTTRYPHWGRLRGETKVFDMAELPKVPDNTLVVFGGPETQFLAPFIAEKSKNVSFVSVGGDPRIVLDSLGESKLTRMLKDKIASHTGPVCVLVTQGYRHHLKYMSRLGLTMEPLLYQPFSNSYDKFELYHARQNGSADAVRIAAEKAHFINNIMVLGKTSWGVGDAVFRSGWGRVEKKDGRDFCWSEGGASTIAFFIRGADELPTKLRLKGFSRGRQRAAVKLNGVEIFSGAIPEEGEKTILWEMRLPAGVLRTVERGANVLEFQWADAVLFDNRAWPDGPRPGFGDRRVVAFAVEEAGVD